MLLVLKGRIGLWGLSDYFWGKDSNNFEVMGALGWWSLRVGEQGFWGLFSNLFVKACFSYGSSLV